MRTATNTSVRDMSNSRHYTDEGLRQLLSDLDEGEQTMLAAGGALPARFKDLNPQLTGSDVAELIRLAENEGDAPTINTA